MCIIYTHDAIARQPRPAPAWLRIEGMRSALLVYDHVARTVDHFTDRGWRRAFGWLGAFVAYYSFIYAPGHGIPVDTGGVNIFLSMVTATFVSRGVEKLARERGVASPTGGLVNNEALA